MSDPPGPAGGRAGADADAEWDRDCALVVGLLLAAGSVAALRAGQRTLGIVCAVLAALLLVLGFSLWAWPHWAARRSARSRGGRPG